MRIKVKFLFFMMILTLMSALCVTLCAAESDFSAITSTSTHTAGNGRYTEQNLIDGNKSYGAPVWVSNDSTAPATKGVETDLTPRGEVSLTLTLKETQSVKGIVLWPHMGMNSDVERDPGQAFPRGFDISVSKDGGQTYTHVKSITNYIISGIVTGQGFTFTEQTGVTHVKIKITQMGWYPAAPSGRNMANAYAKFSEIELYDPLEYATNYATTEIDASYLEIDYAAGKLILPTLDGYNVSLHSSSDTSVIGLDGSVDTSKSATVKLVLTLTDKSDSTVKANTNELEVKINSNYHLASEIGIDNVAEMVLPTSSHTKYNKNYLFDNHFTANGISYPKEFWANGDDISRTTQNVEININLGQKQSVGCIKLYPANNGTENTPTILVGPKNFTVYVSDNQNGPWTRVLVKNDQSANADGSPDIFWLNGMPEGQWVKIHITRFAANSNYAHIGELKLYTGGSANDVAAEIRAEYVEIDYTNKKLILPDIEGYSVSLHSSSDTSVIGLDGSVDITKSATVKLVLALTDKSDSAIKTYTDELSVTVNPLQVFIEEKKVSGVTASSEHTKYV